MSIVIHFIKYKFIRTNSSKILQIVSRKCAAIKTFLYFTSHSFTCILSLFSLVCVPGTAVGCMAELENGPWHETCATFSGV